LVSIERCADIIEVEVNIDRIDIEVECTLRGGQVGALRIG